MVILMYILSCEVVCKYVLILNKICQSGCEYVFPYIFGRNVLIGKIILQIYRFLFNSSFKKSENVSHHHEGMKIDST